MYSIQAEASLCLGLGLSLLKRVKNSLEVFRPHGDLDSLLSFNLSMYQVCI